MDVSSQTCSLLLKNFKTFQQDSNLTPPSPGQVHLFWKSTPKLFSRAARVDQLFKCAQSFWGEMNANYHFYGVVKGLYVEL